MTDDSTSSDRPQPRADARPSSTTKGPLLVLAGAGSGKTRVITHRLARLVAAGADPRTIVAVTFTNKAARGDARAGAAAARRRARSAPSSAPSTPGALRFLRRRAREANLPPRFAIADSSDQLALVKEAMAELAISEQVLPPGRRARPDLAGEERPRSRRSGSTATQTDFAGERIAQVYALYEKKLAATGRPRLRRPDRPLRAAALGQTPASLAEERRRVRHLLIDEYQDTNTVAGRARQAPRRGRGLALRRRRRGPGDLPLARRRGRAHPPLRRGLSGRARRRARGATTARPRRSCAAAAGLVSHNRRRREKRLRADRGDGRARAPLALRGGPRGGRGGRARDRRTRAGRPARSRSSTAPTRSRGRSRRSSCGGGSRTSSSAA